MGIVYELKTAGEISVIPIPVGKLKLCNIKFRNRSKLSLLSILTRYISFFLLGREILKHFYILS